MTVGVLNRRAAIGVLAAGIALTSGAVAASAAQSSTLSGLIQAHREASLAYCRYDTEVAGPAAAACKAAIDAIPHVTTSASFDSMMGTREHLSTKSRATVATARRILAEQRPRDEWIDTLRELVDHADAREDRERALRKEHRLAAIIRIEGWLGARETEALAAVVEHPAETVAELRMKVDYLVETSEWEFPPVMEAIAADVRRLAGAA